MSLTDAEVTRILRIVDELKDVEVRLEIDGMKLHVRKFSGGPSTDRARMSSALSTSPGVQPEVPVAPVGPALTPQRTVPAVANTRAPAGTISIRAPMLGRMYRAPSPTEPPYVEVGSNVEPDDTVCVIEVMKLFNTVKAGVRGTVVAVNAENGEMVEHDAVLFLVEPR